MDENNDLRLTIETARKNKNWTRRCYGYELAMEYFTLLEPDCYELCSYCEAIPEFLEEKNECCLAKALGAVKVFVNRCIDAPSIARAVTRVIIEKVFGASTKVREIATNIILDFIEWEACNAVLKELIAGALKYEGVRSDECIRAMRYALLDFGPHVISIYKLIDFIAALVRNKSFLSIEDECSQLLIVIYKCLGPQVRDHLTNILDPDYILAIEASFEEMRNIPIYHSRFVRYSKDNTSSVRGSDEDMFAVCRIPKPTPHPSPLPTNYENEGVEFERGGVLLEADQPRFRDFVGEPYYRAGDDGFVGNENKGYWEPQRFVNVTNYQMDYGVGGGDQHQRNGLIVYEDDATDCDLFDDPNGYSIPELFRQLPAFFPEPEQRACLWNQYNFEQFDDHSRPVSTLDKGCQNDGYSLQPTSPFEIIIQKLMDKYGIEDILFWLCSKLNSSPKTPLNDEGTEEFMKIHLSRNCKSLEALVTIKEQIPTKPSTISNAGGRRCFPDRITTSSYFNNLNNNPKCLSNINKKDNSIGKNAFPSLENNRTRSLHVSEQENESTAEPLIPYESLILSQEYHQTTLFHEAKENISDFVVSQTRTTKGRSVITFFQKILFPSLKKKKTGNNAPGDWKSSNEKLVFKEQKSYRKYDDFLNESQQIVNFHQDEPIDLPCKKEKKSSYFGKHINNCRFTYSTNRSTRFPSHRTVFSNSRQHLHQNQISKGFVSNPDELQDNICRGEENQSSSNIAKENDDEEVICLSESESISEVSPNFCCYCFQKNSIRRQASKKRESNSQGDQKTCEDDKNKPEKENLPCHPGSDVRTLVLERRNENTFSLKTEGDLLGVTSLRHRGSGDELSQPQLNVQEGQEEPGREEERQGAQRGQQLFCCISMDDTNEQVFQFGS